MRTLLSILYMILLVNNSIAQESVQNTFQVDYTVADEQSMNSLAYSWSLRTNYAYQNQGDYQLKYAVAVLDSLIEKNLTPHPRSEILNYSLDTVHTLFGHTNTSGDTNSIIFRVIDLGVNNYPDISTDQVLWSDTIETDTSFFGVNSWNYFGQKDFGVNLTGLVSDQKVGVICEFYGSPGDTLGLLYSYFPEGICDSIPSQYKSAKSNFWPHSYSYYNANDSLYPRSTGVDLYLDCNGNSSYDNDDGDSYFQNLEFWFTVSVEECDLSTSIDITHEIDTGCNGELTVSAIGDASPYTYLWDLNAGNQTTATATGLCGGEYCVTVTNQDSCQSIICESFYPVGIAYKSSLDKLKIFPNPSNGEFNVSLNGVEADDYTFTVVNVLGETVLNETIQAAGTYTEQMDLSNLGKGVYVLTVSNSKSKSTHKLTIK